jgi:cyanophycinase
MQGTLALVGSGEYLTPMEPVDRLLLERFGRPARVACLPTAAGTEGTERLAYWSRLGVEHFTRLGAQAEAVPIIDRRSANDVDLAQRVRAADFVYLSGGKPKYLRDALQDTAAWDALQDVLARGGVVAGCSAGAMVFGASIPGFPTPWPTHPGFGLLPGAMIIPHYDEIPEHYVRVIKGMVASHLTLLGIEGNTALMRTGETYSVAGAGSVTVWNTQGKTRYGHGQTVDWS